jgi:hypothetical protein
MYIYIYIYKGRYLKKRNCKVVSDLILNNNITIYPFIFTLKIFRNFKLSRSFSSFLIKLLNNDKQTERLKGHSLV